MGGPSRRSTRFVVERLLEPDVLDGLPLVGVGTSAQVRRAGRFAVKVAHGDAASRRRVRREAELLLALQGGGVPVPRLYRVRDDGAAFVRDHLPGPPLLAVLRAGDDDALAAWLDAAFATYLACEAERARGRALDFTPPNLFLARRAGRARVVLADVGERAAPSPFVELRSPRELRAALLDYLPWRDAFERARPVPLSLPPSGRCHVDVEVGPVPGARLVWVNERLREQLGLPSSRRGLLRLANWSTEAPRLVTTRPATRYKDSLGTGERDAKGDGRSVSLGVLGDGRRAPRVELLLKGCGPTPLAWVGHEHHEDGRVSFPRTLWETTVCDELARLGFDVPEVLAVVTTARTTVDNTAREWPATAAVRVARTHWRLGHVLRFADEPLAMRAVLAEAGRVVVGDGFDPDRPAHLARLSSSFASSLGHDVGRCDALQIHGFNPTLGNVRLDGHLIDFSTVRFFAEHLPGFRFMNDRHVVAETRAVWRPFPAHLVAGLSRAGVVDKARAGALKRRALARFDDEYVRGYLAGADAFLGVGLARVSGARARSLVRELVRVREERADDVVDTGFWKQGPRAPRFDLAGRAPELVTAMRRGDDEPWRVLAAAYPGSLSPRARHAATTFTRALAPWVASAPRPAPRRWDEVFRPFVEARALAELLYGRTHLDDDGAEWQALIRRG